MPLTNDPNQVTVLNLDAARPGKGPFVVTQSFIEPTDPQQKENLYLLRQDGTWVEYATQILLPEEQKISVIFDALGDVTRLLSSLTSEVKAVRETNLDQARISQHFREIDAAGGMLAHIQGYVARYKAQQRPNA
jgi:hypothetical protein